MSSSEQISEIELLKRRLQAFEEASPDLADKIKQREEELRAQAEEEKMLRERERIISNIPDVIENLSRMAIGDLTPDGQVKTDRDDRRRYRTIFQCFGSFTSDESIKMKEVLQMAFETIKDNKREINDLKAKMEKMEEYIAMNRIGPHEPFAASEETSPDLGNNETIPLAKPIDVQIGIPIPKQESFEEDRDEAQMNAAIAAHQRHQKKPKQKTSVNRSFMDSNNVLRWRM